MAFRVNHNIPALNALRNLNKTDEDMTRTLERLSSGLKINRGADGPAALVISEQMRGQIASIQQSIRNSESSISMVQTAEATLSELNRLLVSIRQLAIHAANEGVNDDKMLAADQAEVDNSLDTIDRIAINSRFGSRTLFDGSNGATGVAVGLGLEFISATPETRGSPAEGYPVDITQPATRAEIRGLRPIELGAASGEGDIPFGGNAGAVPEFEITISEGGRNITFSSKSPQDAKVLAKLAAAAQAGLGTDEATKKVQDYVAQRLQQKVDEVGLKVEVFIAKNNRLVDNPTPGTVPPGQPLPEENVLVVRHKEFGSEPSFFVSSTMPEILAEEANTIQQATRGLDVAGTIDTAIGVGKGEILVAPQGVDSEGLRIKFNSIRRVKQRISKLIPSDDLFSFGQEVRMIPNPEIKPLQEMELGAGDFTADLPFDDPIEDARAVAREDEAGFAVFTWEIPTPVVEGSEGFVHVDQNSLAFQVGPTRESQVKIDLLDVKTQQLGTNIENKSGFSSLREVDVTNAVGALDTLLLVDDAIEKISTVRAKLGAFQKNTLESNTSSLRVANENLTSAESVLRDTDMAEEMSRFTRNQIMITSGIAMLAQANQTPQAVLQLLNAGS